MCRRRPTFNENEGHVERGVVGVFTRNLLVKRRIRRNGGIFKGGFADANDGIWVGMEGMEVEEVGEVALWDGNWEGTVWYFGIMCMI